MATAKSFNDLFSTAKMMVTFDAQSNLDLHQMPSGIREAINEYQDKVKDLATLLPIIKFEREIATTRLDVKSGSNSLRSSLNTIQEHIDTLNAAKTITSDKAQTLSGQIKNIDKELVVSENNSTTLYNSYLKLCEERLQAKRANNPAELAKIENKLRTDREQIEKSFAEQEKLRAKMRAVYVETATAAKARGVIISEPVMDLPRASKP